MECLVKLRERDISAGAVGVSWGKKAATSHGMDKPQRDSERSEKFS